MATCFLITSAPNHPHRAAPPTGFGGSDGNLHIPPCLDKDSGRFSRSFLPPHCQSLQTFKTRLRHQEQRGLCKQGRASHRLSELQTAPALGGQACLTGGGNTHVCLHTHRHIGHVHVGTHIPTCMNTHEHMCAHSCTPTILWAGQWFQETTRLPPWSRLPRPLSSEDVGLLCELSGHGPGACSVCGGWGGGRGSSPALETRGWRVLSPPPPASGLQSDPSLPRSKPPSSSPLPGAGAQAARRLPSSQLGSALGLGHVMSPGTVQLHACCSL